MMSSSAAPAPPVAPSQTAAPAPTAAQIAFRKAFEENLELDRKAALKGKPRIKLGERTVPSLAHTVAKPPCDGAKPAHGGGFAKPRRNKKWYQQQLLFSSDAADSSPMVRNPYRANVPRPTLNVSGQAARKLVFPK